eukprot:1157357-Pelagomonas_calceolata.AAC.7
MQRKYQHTILCLQREELQLLSEGTNVITFSEFARLASSHGCSRYEKSFKFGSMERCAWTISASAQAFPYNISPLSACAPQIEPLRRKQCWIAFFAVHLEAYLKGRENA